jgi:hypothetical protein
LVNVNCWTLSPVCILPKVEIATRLSTALAAWLQEACNARIATNDSANRNSIDMGIEVIVK